MMIAVVLDLGLAIAPEMSEHELGGGRRMGVPVESVAVGKCYVTEIGQVRRVLEVKMAMVKYESRGKTAHGGSWGTLTTISILKFARDVEREVPCDYDPRYPAGTRNPIDE
jgi:hypothetical protein